MLALFDIDGTLLLSGGAGTRALDRLFADRYGLADAMTGIRPDGKTDPAILDEIMAGRLGRRAEEPEMADLLAAYVELLRDELARSARFRVLPGAADAVRSLAGRAGWTVGVATGNVRAAADLKLERAGLAEYFAVGGYGDDSADRAALVARAIERAEERAGRRFAGDDVVVIGDTTRDIAAARAVGARVVAVATGSTARAALEAERPEAVIDSLAELAGVL